jgi:hypothetical protein
MDLSVAFRPVFGIVAQVANFASYRGSWPELNTRASKCFLNVLA